MSNATLEESEQGVRVHVPMKFRNRSGRKEIVVPDSIEQSDDASPDYHEALVIAISRAHRWKKLMDEGRYGSIRQMATKFGIAHPYMARIMRLTLLAPDIIEAILDGKEPDGLSLEQLRRPMPVSWEEQKTRLLCNMIKASSQHYAPAGSPEPAGCSLYQELNRQSLR